MDEAVSVNASRERTSGALSGDLNTSATRPLESTETATQSAKRVCRLVVRQPAFCCHEASARCAVATRRVKAPLRF
jgi:hypothetical protein